MMPQLDPHALQFLSRSAADPTGLNHTFHITCDHACEPEADKEGDSSVS